MAEKSSQPAQPKRGRATAKKSTGRVPTASKKGSQTAKAAGKRGAAKAKRTGHNQPGRSDSK